MRPLPNFKTVDDYLRLHDPETSSLLKQLRDIIRKAAPDAEESISYNMPAYKQFGPLVYFAAYDHHIGFYPTPSAIMKFADDLKKYETAKGTVQFKLNQKLPTALITKMVKFRVRENKEKSELKKSIKQKR